jgi:hypothetical protein
LQPLIHSRIACIFRAKNIGGSSMTIRCLAKVAAGEATPPIGKGAPAAQ